MPISVQCPICRKMFSSHESHEGKTVACPSCKERFTIRRFSPEDAAWDSVQRPKTDLHDMAMQEESAPRAAPPPLQRKVFPGGKFCSTCGASIHPMAEVCPHCGVRQSGSPSSNRPNRVVAFLLAFFLGPLGVHKFYLGQSGAGVAYLLISILGSPLILPPLIMSLISIIEGVTYLVATTDDRFAN